MRRTQLCAVLLTIGGTIPLLLSIGCAAEAPLRPGPEAAPPSSPAGVSPVAAPAEVARLADKAYQEEDYPRAVELYEWALARSDRLSPELAESARIHLGRARNVLHQRRLARRQQAVQEAEAAIAEGPDAAVRKGEELNAELARLARQGRHDRAAPLVAALEALRPHLTPEAVARYDILRNEVVKATVRVRPHEPEERRSRAEGHFAAGMEAFETEDYPLARLHLQAASSFGVGFGLLGNMALNGALDDIADANAALEENVRRARELHEEGRYDAARELLVQTKERRRELGWEPAVPLNELLADTDAEIARQKARRQERRRKEAVQMLASARAGVRAEQYEEAARLLFELSRRREDLDEEQTKQFHALAEAVEEATGVPPTLTEEEAEARAKDHFQRGLKAYEQKRYAEAEELLAAAARMNVDLWFWDERTLRSRLAEVQQKLRELRARFELGKQHYEAGNYRQAEPALRAVAESGIQIGGGRLEEARNLWEESRRELAEQEKRRREQARRRAVSSLQKASDLGADGRYAEAAVALAELQGLEDHLSAQQRRRAERLRDEVEQGAKAEEVAERLAKAEQLQQRAAEMLRTQQYVESRLRKAQRRSQEGELEDARVLLLEAKEKLAGSRVADSPSLARAARRLDSMLSQVRADIKEKQQRAQWRAELNEMFAAAKALLAEDVLEAEQKLEAALQFARRHDIVPTHEQDKIGEQVRSEVDTIYGPVRRVRPSLYQRLASLADRYRSRGSHRKAAQMLALTQKAPAEMLPEDRRREAREGLEEAEAAVREQRKTAAALRRKLKEARLAFTQDRPYRGADLAEEAVETALQENLLGPDLVAILGETVGLLESEFESALARAYPALEQTIDQADTTRKVAVARVLAPYYLQVGSPEQARPYLEELAGNQAAPQEEAQWASQQLEDLQARQREARKARLLEVQEETDAVLELAEELQRAAGGGQAQEVRRVEHRLAAAKVRLQVKQARLALERADPEAAASALRDAPTQEADTETVEELFRPLLGRVQALVAARRKMAGAEATFAAYKVGEAQEALLSLKGLQEQTEPLKVRREALARAIDSVLRLQDRRTILKARQRQLLQEARPHLANAKGRRQAWARFYSGVRAFLQDAEGAEAALEEAVASEGNLLPFERDIAARVMEAMAATRRVPAAKQARQKLQEATEAFGNKRYLQAGSLLAKLEKMPGFALLRPETVAEARALKQKVAAKEREARALYRRAVQAYRAGDPARVGRILDELEHEYRHTSVYQEHL